jgi:hypothetical protein
VRLLFSILALLGLAVAGLSACVWAEQAPQWSSVIAAASETGALENEAFAQRLTNFGLPQSSFAGVQLFVGVAICLIAIWRLTIETRPRDDSKI